MALYKDKRTGIWYVSYTDPAGRRVRKSLETKNRNVAAIKEGEYLTRRKAADTVRMPLEVFLARYRAYLKETRKPPTVRIFERAMRELLEYKKIEFIDEITPAFLDGFALTQKAKIKKDTAAGLNRKVRAIKTAMRQAEFWDLLPVQKWERVTKFKENKHRLEFHSPQEIAQILEVCPSLALVVVVMLGCRAGLRRGEMAALKWPHVDFARRGVWVAPHKTDKGRLVPLAADLRSVLIRAKKAAQSDYVVELGDGSSRNSTGFISAYYRKTMKELVPFHCFLHKLRHTFASHLVQHGVDLYRVSKLMGHSSIKMTERYAHLAPPNFEEAITCLPAVKMPPLPQKKKKQKPGKK